MRAVRLTKLATLAPVALLVCASIFFSGCANTPSIPKQSRSNAFEVAVTTYTKLIRWGYVDEAAKYIRAADDSPIEIDFERAARYRVTGYRNASQLTADNLREGRVVAVIEYYEIDSGVLHELRDEQHWWYDDETKRWFLGSPLPAFGVR